MNQIDLGDVMLTVHSRGSGPPLVLLHGFPFDHRMWSGQEPLADSLRVVAPDLRGFGGSTAGDGIESIRQLADDVARLMDALHLKTGAILCGLSMGGYVAQQLAVHHPSKFRGLILVDTRLEADTDAVRAGRAELAASVGRLGSRVAAEAMVPKLLAASTAGSPARRTVEEELRRMILSTSPETIIAALAALAARPDMRSAMAAVRVPTLLVVGEEDVITPPEAMRTILDVMPHAELLVVPGCGHMTPMERPEIFNRAMIDFVARI